MKSINYANIPEINLREEVESIIDGTDFGEEHFQPIILKRARRDVAGNTIKCTCWNEVSQEGTIGCHGCDGLGFLWEESLSQGFMYYITTKTMVRGLDYITEAGRSQKYEMGLVTKFDVEVKQKDRVIVPKMNSDGAILFPIIEDEQYYVVNNRNFRLDSGKSEFNVAILSRVE